MSTYYELQPAYGRGYKSAKEVKQAWEENKDFMGDYQLSFTRAAVAGQLLASIGSLS